MHPRLPVELLRAIVDNFRLPLFTSHLQTQKFEGKTRSILCSLSLTSRVFREIAQPLLYNFVRIPRGKTIKTLSLLVEHGKKNNRLSSTQTIVFGMLLSAVQQLISSSNLWNLDKFHGSNLSRIFLNGVKLESSSLSCLSFPSVKVLGLYGSYNDVIFPDPLPAAIFPSLRHLGFDNDRMMLRPEETLTLVALLPQLDSLTLRVDIFSHAVLEIPSLPLASILVDVPVGDGVEDVVGQVEEEEPSIVNLRLLALDPFRDGSICKPSLEFYASLLENPNRFARLEAIYLPSLSSLLEEYRTDAKTLAVVEHVALAARKRNIRVVVEEQSDYLTGECQISEDFMTRMTQKRIARDAEGKGGK
ncbi:uncharacterized protein JCM6883_007432 [Sporobolomyces salmoneus]|uniref:uncharacterized protein n=1 Tax=Sporobolomyces salmoneus TaxID=183962 RepID=UPI00317D4C5C